jgi:predicted secreted protein
MTKYLFSLLMLLSSPWALAQSVPATTLLDAQASQEVENDELWVSLSVSRDGPNPTDITQAVLAKLNATVAQARKLDGVQLQVGNVHTSPVWGPKGKTNHWTAQAELSLVSTNTHALGQLASELSSLMQLQGVQFRLSKNKRLQIEQALLNDMAASFKDRASSIAVAFGFKTYRIQSLNFNPKQERPYPMPMAMARSMATDAAAISIPNEGGKTTVSVGMQASIELLP